jgi:enoyl-CoA hydratase
MGISHLVSDGIAEMVMDNPPVNALTVAGWFELADIVTRLGADPAVRVLILAAEGRGFNAGVEIKEMQNTEGYDALIGANRGCFAAFAAVYECEVPVIAAVHGYCLGGSIGLAGNADIIIASDDATFGLPEVDRGALGAATHLARLVPQHKMRAMVYTRRRRPRPSSTTSAQCSTWCPAPIFERRPGRSRATLRPRARPSSAGPRSRSTVSTPSTSNAATDSSKASPSSSTSDGVFDEARQAFVDKREAEFDK